MGTLRFKAGVFNFFLCLRAHFLNIGRAGGATEFFKVIFCLTLENIHFYNIIQYYGSRTFVIVVLAGIGLGIPALLRCLSLELLLIQNPINFGQN